MRPATIETYGGEFSDAEPVENTSTQMSAAQDAVRSEHLAQLTRVTPRVWIRFLTRLTNGDVTIVGQTSLWGDTASYHPTSKLRTAAGVYEFTWPAQFTDGRGEAETLSFSAGWGNIRSEATDFGFIQVCGSGTSYQVFIADATGTPSDLTNVTSIDLFLL